MTRQEIQKKLFKIIAAQYGRYDEQQITPEKNFVEDFNGDSLDTVELCMTLEDEFDIEITDDEMEAATTVQGLFDLIERLVPADASADVA